MKHKRFGYKFWKDVGEMASYGLIALSLLATFATKAAGLVGLVVIAFCLTMMIIEEYKGG